MPKLTKANIRAIEGVRDAILAEPALYDQRWFADVDNPCGGACCLAGWAVWLDNPEEFDALARKGSNMHRAAEKLFGCGIHDSFLFGSGALWPLPYADQLTAATTKKARAKVAASLLDAIIATNGQVLNG